MEEIQYEAGELPWHPSDNNKFQSTDGFDLSKPQEGFKPKRIFTAPDDAVKTIYTDGGSRILTTDQGKRYVGAWSFWCKEDNELQGKAEDNSTNNQMELLATIRALEYCDSLGVPKDKWVVIKLDSDYVRLGMLFWTKKWASQNWIKYDQEGRPQEIKNLELWQKLYELSHSRKVYYDKVKGHSGDEGNEKVDINCGELMDNFIKTAGINIMKNRN